MQRYEYFLLPENVDKRPGDCFWSTINKTYQTDTVTIPGSLLHWSFSIWWGRFSTGKSVAKSHLDPLTSVNYYAESDPNQFDGNKTLFVLRQLHGIGQ